MTEPVPPAQPPVQTAPLVNVANALTVFRIILVPVFVVVFFVDDGTSASWRIGAFVIFAVAAITDRLDGSIARSWGLVTDFGKLADPIADKALIGAALLSLSVLGVVPWWITVVILAREVGVTLLRFWVIRHGVIAASKGGKLKTMLQSVALGLLVLPLQGIAYDVAMWILYAAVAVTIVTGLDYVWHALRMRRRAAERPRGRDGRTP
ncbi:MAG: CDP-diacylglycerol--glycerol-3-phosphate 3-phosphatidyltransferase [Gordonia sp. (in: high G+C Gram-positive bacteria)]|uniref:CDP-diacylglycerol--glycerol-3-phosphate 3-phosphatidyltransferase n=1 Tax=Gordonia sp. (in: high G+C Gram-positive bacteria) TaxID=84139 RepID=UPI0039E5B393